MTCSVPEFSIAPLAITVFESARKVEICVTTNSSLAREIEVTAKPSLTGGSHNPAEGIANIEACSIAIKY